MSDASPRPGARHSEREWLPMVALLHARPGRADHVDWMLARDAEGTTPLWTFRAGRCPVDVPEGPIGLRAIADHRPRYLEYEGPVSGHRGTVRRLARGRYRVRSSPPMAAPVDATATWTLEVAWDDAPAYFVRIGTKLPVGPAQSPPPDAESAAEAVHWVVIAPDPGPDST